MKPGDIVIVEPADEDDPIARLHRGERCKLIRFTTAQMNQQYAVVQFSTKGLPVWLRVCDLREQLPEEKEIEHESN